MADESNKPAGTAGEEKVEKEKSPAEIAEEVLEQRRASARYMNSNFWSEWAEIYRNIHARTVPHSKGRGRYAEETGSDIEHGGDEGDGRTNVCVPDHFVMLRRGTARLTRNPPNLRVRGGPDDDQGKEKRDKVSAHLMFQWDRSESQRAFKKVVNIGYGAGWSVGKVYYDKVPIIRRLRKLTTTLQPKDFDNLANAKDPRIAALVGRFGDRLKDETPFNENEMSLMVQELGDEAKLDQSTIKYQGPVLASVFAGDVFPEAGFASLQESSYVVENSMRDEDWLKYWTNQTSIDPITGESKPVMTEEAVAKALETGSSKRSRIDAEGLSLRRLMREELEIADPDTSGKPIKAARKRLMIDERHSVVNGHMCVDFVAEDNQYLGRLWYPWETYGKYTYAELVLIPDWLGGIGLSTLAVTRFLLKLRNVRMNQTTDFINNVLLPFMKHRRGEDLTKYDIARTGWGRLLELGNLDDLQIEQPGTFPSEAWQDQVQYQQQMQQVDPSTVDYSPGTSDVATPGKFATTAKLADKAADSVTADMLDQLGMFIRDVVELNLTMNQQAMSQTEDVEKTYLDRIEAESIRNASGQARIIKISPMDYQEVFEVLPEQGSTLAADDEFRVAGLQQFIALGERHPDIVDLRKCFQRLAKATPGIDDDIILPPPPPTPPEPPVKLNISLAIKWAELPDDVKAAIFTREGLPTEGIHIEGVHNLIDHASEAADSAANLDSIAHPEPAPTNGKGKPSGTAKPKRPSNGQ